MTYHAKNSTAEKNLWANWFRRNAFLQDSLFAAADRIHRIEEALHKMIDEETIDFSDPRLIRIDNLLEQIFDRVDTLIVQRADMELYESDDHFMVAILRLQR